MLSITVRSRFRSCSRASSALRRSVISRKTRTAPKIFPLLSLIGAPLSSIGILWPFLEISMVWLARAVMIPLVKILVSGLRAFRPVRSLMMLNTNGNLFPEASWSDQPVNFSATGFRKVISPCGSVVITASPMLFKVVERRVHFSLTISFI